MIPIAKVIVSPTEPTGKNRKKVWMQKGKNILDKKMLILNRALNTDDGSVSSLTSGNYYGTEKYIPFSQYANKQISISTRMSIAFYDSTKQFISSITTNQTNSGIVPSNTSFMRCDVYKDNYNEAQIEQGPNATDYEAYIEPKIYIKNSNDVYEEFIKKQEEQVLWTNTSPSSSFSEQTISIDLSKYSKIYIVYKGKNTDTNFQVTGLFDIGKKYFINNASFFNFTRPVEVTQNSVIFNSDYYYKELGNTATTIQNDYNIPYQIIGLKEV